MNRATGATRRRLEWLFLYLGAQTVIIFQTLVLEYTSRTLLHTSLPYRVMAIFIPFILAAVSRASRQKYSATIITGYYMAFVIAEILILPLFPAEPKLGPVYHPVHQFIPAQFPVLLIVPAFVLDVFWNRTRKWNPANASRPERFLRRGIHGLFREPAIDARAAPISHHRHRCRPLDEHRASCGIRVCEHIDRRSVGQLDERSKAVACAFYVCLARLCSRPRSPRRTWAVPTHISTRRPVRISSSSRFSRRP
jgi:hypothetical protein